MACRPGHIVKRAKQMLSLKSCLCLVAWFALFFANPGVTYATALAINCIWLILAPLYFLPSLKQRLTRIGGILAANYLCLFGLTLLAWGMSHSVYLSFYYPSNSGLLFGRNGVVIKFYPVPYDRQADGFELIRIGKATGSARIEETIFNYYPNSDFIDSRVQYTHLFASLALTAPLFYWTIRRR